MPNFDNAARVAKMETLVMKTYNETPSFFKQACTEFPLTGTDVIDLAYLKSLSQMREWVGPRVFHDISSGNYLIKTKPYENSASAGRNDFEYNRTAALEALLTQYAQEAQRHPDTLVCQVLAAGESGSGIDGKPLFADDHPNGAGGTYDNLLGGTGTTITALVTDLQAARLAMRKFQPFRRNASDNRILNLAPDAIFCPVDLSEKFYEIATATDLIISGVKQENPLKGRLDPEKIFTDGEFSDANDWYYAHTAGVVKPLAYVWNRPLAITVQGLDSYHQFLTRDICFGLDMECTVAPLAPWLVIKIKNT